VHSKWAKKVGIDKFIADFVDRNIDYGSSWAFTKHENDFSVKEYESPIAKQLNFFYQKDLDEKYDPNSYVKAYYLHHLLDYFRETRVNINDLDLVFEKFLQRKVIIEFTDSDGNEINYREVVEELFKLLKDNKKELLSDLKGGYFTN